MVQNFSFTEDEAHELAAHAESTLLVADQAQKGVYIFNTPIKI
jgi:hypothetical protein